MVPFGWSAVHQNSVCKFYEGHPPRNIPAKFELIPMETVRALEFQRFSEIKKWSHLGGQPFIKILYASFMKDPLKEHSSQV